MPRVVAGDVTAAQCVDVEADRDEQRHGTGRSLGGGPRDQPGPRLSHLGDDVDRRVLHRLDVAGEGRSDERVRGVEPCRLGAEGAEQVGELAVAVRERDLDRRACAAGCAPR